MRWLWMSLLVAACGGAAASGTASAPATASATASVTASASATATASDLQSRHKQAYAEATAAAGRGDMDAAIRALSRIADEVQDRDDEPLAYWIHNELTWLHWAKGDNPGALAETMKGKAALDRSKLPADKVRSMRLHQLWDAAYLLLEIALAKPASQRAAAMAAADAAHSEYEALGRAADDRNGMAVLWTFFYLRKGDVMHAAMTTDRVDVAHDDDVQDLYVLAATHQRVGDTEKADELRKRICGADTYLMKPLIVAQLAREGHPCPAP